MRTKALVTMAILPVALAITPSHARAQSVRDGCRTIYSWSPSRYYDCTYDASQIGREAAARAREAAARVRELSRESARWAQAREREYAARARAESRAWERSMSQARLRADQLRNRLRAEDRAREMRDRAQELRDRARERARDREYDRRDRYYRRW